MKSKLTLKIAPALLLLSTLNSQISTASAQGTAFTYQGRLSDGANPASGIYDLRFTIYDTGGGSGLVAGPVTNSPTGVTNGLFTVTLDFGAGVFTGAERWLDVGVRTNGGSAFTTLVPRQKLTPAPYAVFAGGAQAAASVAAGEVNSAALATGAVASSAIADGSIAVQDLSPGLLNNTFWRLDGNTGTTPGAHFLGTADNGALELKVNNARALRLEPNGVSPNFIGGHPDNLVSNGFLGATISGGGGAGILKHKVGGNHATIGGGVANTASGHTATIAGGGTNSASGSYATVGGGDSNAADADHATVAGGWVNAAGALYAAVGGGKENTASASFATVSGGDGNTASRTAAFVGGGRHNSAGGLYATVSGGDSNAADADHATVAGGWVNAAGALYASVGGGLGNTASGNYATVPGGHNNFATTRAFAAGQNAQANHAGCFVWSSRDNPAPSFATNRFHVHASEGFSVDYAGQRGDGGGQRWVVLGGYSDFSGQTISTWTGARLTDGGVWTDNSDRNAKENFAPVDGSEVLAKVAALPVQTWNYKTEGPDVRHIGPVAQDFHAAFGLGNDDKHLAALDSAGVALAAIQGLNQKLEAENAALKQCLTHLEELVRKLATERNGGGR